MIAKSVISLALAGLVACQPLHGHHVHKREAAPEPVDVYVTDFFTSYVTVGFVPPTPTPVAPAPTTSSAAPADTPVGDAANNFAAAAESSVSSSTYSPPAVSIAPTSLVTVVTTSSSSSSTPASTSAAPAASSASAPAAGVGSGGSTGITYSPYNADSSCKSASQVQSDLAQLSGYEVIRLYGVDCNQVGNVYNALASNQKLFLGVFYMNEIQSSIQSMASQMNNDWSKVYTVSIGNELVNDGEATPAQIGQYVATGRSALQSAGYTGPVVSVDTFIAVIENPDLCQYSDYMAVNAHAFFDGTVTADQAGPWALEQIQRVWTACGGAKSVLISESGWPSVGGNNGVAVPSPDNLQAAISSLKSSVGSDVILFSSYNNLWESPGAYGCEQYWGIYGNGSSD
jgi:exo-beta-1,3-glucanase (GH17 family)